MNNNLTSTLALFAAVITASVLAGADDALVIRDNQSYPLATCPVMGLALGDMGEPVVETINDREVRFCCAACIGRYRDNVEDYEAKVDAAIIEQQRDAYPTDRCVVMDTALGSMGDPVDHVHGNRLVRFCCAGCVGMFNEDPAAPLAKLDAAALDKAKSDAHEVCAVTGDALGDTPTTLILGNKALSLHSEDCVEAVRENPSKYLGASGNSNPPADQHSRAVCPVSSDHSHQHGETEHPHNDGWPFRAHEHASGAATHSHGGECTKAGGPQKRSCCG